MNREKILNILKEIRPEYDFSEDVNYIDEGYLDSFDVITLVADLESIFQIKIAGNEINPENFSRLDCIVSIVNRKINQ
jgi:acyl carrier protein